MNDNMDDLLGTPNYDGKSQLKTLGLKYENDLIVRPFPPIKGGKTTGQWRKYIALHWGYEGRRKKDPTKTRPRPVLCIQEKNREGMITQECPCCDDNTEKKDEFEFLVASLKKKNKNPKENEEAVNLAAWLKSHNRDAKHWFYGITDNNEFARIKINHTLMKGWEALLKKLVAEGETPLGVEGMFFVFSRPNKNGREDSVRPNEIRREDGSRVYNRHKLTRPIVEQALNIFPDLNEEVEKFRYSFEQLQELVECSGDPDEVDRILGEVDYSEPEENKSFSKSSELDEEDEVPIKSKSKKAPKPEPKPEVEEETEDEEEETEDEEEETEDEEEELRKLEAALAAKKASKAKKTKASKSVKVETEEDEVESKESGESEDWEDVFNT